MSGYRLVAPQDATSALAQVLLGTGQARIEVVEDKCFEDGRPWSLGLIVAVGDNNKPRDMRAAVQKGAYEWRVRDLEGARADLLSLLRVEEPPPTARDNAKEAHKKTVSRVGRTLEAVASAAVRLGFTHPIFDPRSVENMPFRRATTVIADTSGALQGGLDFVARFLHPQARLKVPAVVHMEVVNQADNFLKRRRATKLNSSALLFDHLLSQAGQRALLRLELRADTEVERTLLVGDPLRNAFQKDGDAEWSELNISVPLRSYCDRLIIEAARQHQSYATPGHPIQLLTCDQGFARMALAEGIEPLYFQAITAKSFFGRRLGGTSFHPFHANLYRVPLQSTLWELATAFGSARLVSEDGSRSVEITAIGEHLSWSPVHSRDDLLWMRTEGFNPEEEGGEDDDREPEKAAAAPADVPPKDRAPKNVSAPVAAQAVKSRAQPDGVAVYRFSVERLLEMLWALSKDGMLTEQKAMQIAKVATASALSEYRRFLLAGDYMHLVQEEWVPTDNGLALATAITTADLGSISASVRRIPSVAKVLDALAGAAIGTSVALPVPERALTTYRTLAEIVCAGAPVAGQQFFPSPTSPKLEEFSSMALERFEELDTGDGFVSVGAWLEALLMKDGVHPEVVRRSLDEAVAAGLLTRSTEGSTTDTRHDQHTIKVLRALPTGPRVETIHIYRGDFLIPGKSSSSIRLRRSA